MQVDINGINYHYQIDGPEGAPWITFSHALANNLTLWDGITEALSDRYRILRFDHPGHGKTPSVPGPYSFDMLIENTIGLLDALDISSTHWVGLSIGGMMGYGMAARNSDRLISLIACDSRPDAPPDYADYFQHRIDVAQKKGMEGLVDLTINRWFRPETISENPPVLEKVRQMIRNTDPVGHAGCCEALKKLSFGSILGDIKVPTLIVGGQFDKGAPVKALAETANQIPGAKHKVISNAGHITPLENPEEFQEVIECFLQEVGND